jgi:hypothetical protein
MITTVQEFYQNYMMKDGDLLAEELLNKPFFRLKYELQALISFFKLDNVPDWNSTTYYKESDAVFYNNRFWVCIKPSRGSAPDSNSSNWVLSSFDVLTGAKIAIETEEHIISGVTNSVAFTNFPRVVFLNGFLLDSSEYRVNDDNTVTLISKYFNLDDIVTAIITSNTINETNSPIVGIEEHISDGKSNSITFTNTPKILFVNSVMISSSEYSINGNTVTFTSTLDPGIVVSSLIISNTTNGANFTITTEEFTSNGQSNFVTFTNDPNLVFLNGALLNLNEYNINNNFVSFLPGVLKSGDIISFVSIRNSINKIKKHEHTYIASEDNNVISVPSDMDLTSIFVYRNGVILRSLTYTVNNHTKEISFIPGTLSDGDWVLIQVV